MGCWSFYEPLPGLSIHLASTDRGLCRLSLRMTTLRFLAGLAGVKGEADWRQEAHPVLREAERQLTNYFERDLRHFDVPLDLRGTEFQKKVWQALLDIPYGETRSYAALATSIESPKAVRAVGAANGANPVAIIVPCHRVIASSGTLGGYSAGLDVKRLLLALESATA